MINFYRELPCVNYEAINKEILVWIDQQELDNHPDRFWNPIDLMALLDACPGFARWLQSHKIPLRSIAITVGRHDACCGPHIDTPPARYKLSWPVKNTHDTWNCWYQCDVAQPKTRINDLGGISYLDSSELQELHRREVMTPAIIDAGIIHDVHFGDSAVCPRMVLQGQFMKEPSHL